MNEELQRFCRGIPQMDTLLSRPWAAEACCLLGREAVKALISETAAAIRAEAATGIISSDAPAATLVEERARRAVERYARRSLRPVVNATGVVAHTNLGRSPLPQEALRAAYDAARGYSTLEYSLDEGARGSRNSHVEWLLRQATGAEAVAVVNNNAAAVLLCLTELGRDKETIVSRGELVEIGGSFRIPDILAFSGTKMLEVGTTNCTHAQDYESAITAETALLLKVHPSNFRVLGFSESVPREELAAMAKRHGIICMEDLGSGLLEEVANSEVPALDGEPTVRKCLESGMDVVTFSGDKLLGGPQIGCIAGRRELVERIRKNQLARALRVDKMTLAAFETVLRMYLRGTSNAIPTMAMLRRRNAELKEQAEQLRGALEELFKKLGLNQAVLPRLRLVETEDAVGGGAFPATPLPGWGVELDFRTVKAGRLAARLREAETPVICGVREDKIILHLRTLQPGDAAAVIQALTGIFQAPAEHV